jgi:hypothetical protein
VYFLRTIDLVVLSLWSRDLRTVYALRTLGSWVRGANICVYKIKKLKTRRRKNKRAVVPLIIIIITTTTTIILYCASPTLFKSSTKIRNV